MLDPRLQSLRLVARFGSVRAAAAASHYTPSAVSAQLRSLADDVGAPLLERDGRGVRLAGAGRILLEHADEASALWEAALARARSGVASGHGSITLCGFSTAASTLLPEAAGALLAKHPDSAVKIVEADPRECFDLLLTGDADVAVVVSTGELPPLDDPRFEQRHLGQDPLDLLVPARHPFAGRESVLLAEAAGERWIMDRPGRPYRQLLMAACMAAGFTPAVAHEAVEWDTGAALVHAGLGVILIPQLARTPSGYDIVRVPLRGNPRPVRTILSAVRAGSAGQPLVATALRSMARSEVLTTRR
ncbi:MAG: LysR family transcriptional regulator [Dermatophilus congolensis]|nr:LysR family transcriptional regulator [Dermatophilus congolensis]